MSTWDRHNNTICDCAGCRRAVTRKAKRERAAARLVALEAVADAARKHREDMRRQCMADPRPLYEALAALDKEPT